MKRIEDLLLTCLILMFMTLTGCDTVNDSPSSPSITPTKSADDTKSNDNVETVTKEPNDMEATVTSEPTDNVINVYSFAEQDFIIIDKYKALHPDFPYEFKYFYPADAYQPFLDQALNAGGADAPDIYCVESSFALRYTKGDASQYATPYKDLGIDVDNLLNEADIAPYSVDIGTNSENKLVGLSYEGTGSAFIYRRSIAKSVWGTDEPEIIKSKIGPSWDEFFEAAADLKGKGYGIVSGDGDIWHSVESSSDLPWVVDGKLYIDPKREAFLDLAKKLKDNGYSNNTVDWTDDWYADMKGEGKKKIFGFFGPAWLVNYVIKGNSGGDKIGKGTYGDWAVCEPPVGFFWGGTWILANNNSEHKAVLGDIIKWITLDSSDTGLQYYRASGTVFKSDGVKDAVTSGAVMKNSVDKLDFLGGQNMFEVFGQAGKLANGKNITQFDETINRFWRDQVREYTSGKKTREQAITDFKQDVKNNLDIVVE